jgi:CRP-like cAMP-binding protein
MPGPTEKDSDTDMGDISITQRLRESTFFRELPVEVTNFLAAHAQVRRLTESEVVFHFGERAQRFYLVTAGRIAVEVAAIEGPSLQLQDLGPGAVLGWSWLIPPHRWNFQARAKTPAELIEIDGEAVLAECEANPQFGYQLLKRFSALMSERLQHARQRMIEEWRPEGFA